MNELSLFTGIGGGLLGTKLLGWRCIGVVDNDEYCCKVLEQRIKDGCFEPFDIFCMDIREFNRRVAEIYQGKVDVLSAGFPCQPFSVAGKRRGDEDERNMWPATIECIRLVRPRYLLLENVPGLLTHEYVRRIYGDLAESGYCVKWRCLSAAEVGANHKRNRWWIVADNDSSLLPRTIDEIQARRNAPNARCADMAESESERCRETGIDSERSSERTSRSGEMADTEQSGLPESTQGQLGGISEEERIFSGSTANRRDTETEQGNWWSVEPDVGRLADGIPNRVQRLKAIGNAQVPAVVKTVWRLMTDTAKRCRRH